MYSSSSSRIPALRDVELVVPVVPVVPVAVLLALPLFTSASVSMYCAPPAPVAPVVPVVPVVPVELIDPLAGFKHPSTVIVPLAACAVELGGCDGLGLVLCAAMVTPAMAMAPQAAKMCRLMLSASSA
jgi:hypothetical protein